MRAYQDEYIENCKAYKNLTSLHFHGIDSFDADFDAAMDNMRRAEQLSRRNTMLIRSDLLPVLDTIFEQPADILRELEEFADALTSGSNTLDLGIGDQIHEALLRTARQQKRREDIIRELYKLGMVRYLMWNMFTGLNLPQLNSYSMRMRYCFVEAASYIKYFDEFDEETKAYILRSLANIYMGEYTDWRERLDVVRNTMRVFSDERYRASAPGLPWERYMFTIHRQMTSAMPLTFPEGTLSPDAVVDVMESAHLVFERQYEEAAKNGQTVDAHRLMPYYSLEYSCGLISKETLLEHMETFLDGADISCYDEKQDYRAISLVAFYVQYLRQMPDMLPPRRDYVKSLYRRALKYIEQMPPERMSEQTRLSVRQILSVYLELDGGISYRDFLLRMMIHFSPELFAHGYAVGKMAQCICASILEGDPGYFSDIPSLTGLDAGELQERVMDMAYYSGLLHDAGKLSFAGLYNSAGREMLDSEEATLRLHTYAGQIRFSEHKSTSAYTDIALGHHRWYDGSDGYPEDFSRKDCPYRAMVDIIALADFLDSEGGNDTSLHITPIPFEEKLEEVFRLEGRRFSPLVTSWLRDSALQAQLREYCLDGRRLGYYHCFQTVFDADNK